MQVSAVHMTAPPQWAACESHQAGMEGTPQTPPTGGSLGVQDGPCSDPSRALLREKAVSQHWKVGRWC